MKTSKKNIAILMGGNSSEYDVSIRSANEVLRNLDKEKFEIYLILLRQSSWQVLELDGKKINIDKNDFSFIKEGKSIKFDSVFNMIHGTPGEDGKIQAYLEMLNIPHTSCDFLVSALTFHKFACKSLLKNNNIALAKDIFFKKNDEIDKKKIINYFNFPLFIKPNKSGSSFGISKVNNENEILAAIEKSFSEDTEIIIEEFVEGREITCGLVKINNEILAFPLTEIKSKNDFFDFEAKYTPSKVEEITPAQIDEQLTKECQELSKRIYQLLNCKGIVRMDFILKNKTFYFLEVNTIPGMSKESLVPQGIAKSKWKIKDIFTKIIEETIK